MTFEHCYMCEQPACSREHVPPLNLFPASSESGGIDYRINLITVPSCALHNSAKSHDDEFLMVSLAGIIGNNSVGYMHKLGKVDRAVRRSAGRLLDKVVTKKKHVEAVELADNKFVEVIWGTPDIQRLEKCFDHIVRGLHMHHFNAPFQGSVKVHFGYLYHEQPSPRNWNQFIIDRSEIDLQGKLRYGDNSEVFFYQITDKDQYGLFLIRLCFYGGINFYAALCTPDFKAPPDLVSELMNRGVKTVITLGDREYEIN